MKKKKKKDLGNKFVCYQCGCKFYDLTKPQPICPKCGVDQNDAPKKGGPQLAPQAPSLNPSASATRTRGRKAPSDTSLDAPRPFSEEDEDDMGDPPEEQDGLTVVDDNAIEETELHDLHEDA